MARQRVRLRGRFFLLLFGLIAFIVIVVVLVTRGGGSAEVRFGEVTGTIQAAAAIVRDESVVSTEKSQKIIFSVTEGETIETGAQVAQVFKRGYQDESMITLLRLEREIYEHQKTLIPSSASAGLTEIEDRILEVEEQIRTCARGDNSLDLLNLERSLKNLQTERTQYLQNYVTPDAVLNGLYASLVEQQQAMGNWSRNIINSSGSGVISFYFDGYERVLSTAQLSMINAALINSVVKGGNTATATDSSTETPLYRLVHNTHWYIAFVTKATDPMRTVAGEEYFVVFDDYSDLTYQATAIEPIVTDASVVNILEFNVELGDFLGIRTVNATVTKNAQGVMVPVEMLNYEAGIPGVSVKNGDLVTNIPVNILAADENNAVVKPVNATDMLVSGQRIIKTESEAEEE